MRSDTRWSQGCWPCGKTSRVWRAPVILLESYSWTGVMVAAQARLDECEGRDWLEIQEKLRGHFIWEYEGMR